MDRNIPKPVDGYDDGAEPLVFYAPKGNYRKYEQKIYSDLASGVTGPAKGFFKVLVSTRANKLTLVAMIFFVAVVLATSFLSGGKNQRALSDVNLTLSAFSFDGRVYTSLEMKESKKYSRKNGLLFTADFCAVNSDSEVSDKVSDHVIFLPSESKTIHCVFNDYELSKIRCRVTTDDGNVELECSIIHK